MIFKKKEEKLFVVDYDSYRNHRTIVSATDEIHAIKKIVRLARKDNNGKHPDIHEIIPFKEDSDSGDK